ncbi:MAG TPA: type II methionyl aminopeptidase [Vicinamibacteria bacterium]|nr:type II methionyl aminopeptidase [Vicinamibacteria bacterium]
MIEDSLRCLREAGRIAAAGRLLAEREARRGALLREVCERVEREIDRLGGELAFPVQSSVNQVAAHYCPSPEEATTLSPGDLAKLDIGVHINGWVVDTAVTVNVDDAPENRPLVEAARAALAAAIQAAGPGVPVRELSGRIEGTIRSFGLRPLRNLCGHGVARWTVHCPPPIPNVVDSSADVLEEGAVVAVEPFATDGLGLVTESGVAQVFRLDPRRDDSAPGPHPEVMAAIRAHRGLPFARRQLAGFDRSALEATLGLLQREGRLTAYLPLVERTGRRVAQAEHTIYLGKGGAEVLTA